MAVRVDPLKVPGVSESRSDDPRQRPTAPRYEAPEATDLTVDVLPAYAPRWAPRVQTVVRARPAGRAGSVRQRVFVLPTSEPMSPEASGELRLTRRRAFLEKRAGDLRRELENKRQLAAAKRAYAAQLMAAGAKGGRAEAALLDSATSDGAVASLEGELRALEAELSSIAGKLAASVLSEAAQAEGSAAALQASLPAEGPSATSVETTVQMEPTQG